MLVEAAGFEVTEAVAGDSIVEAEAEAADGVVVEGRERPLADVMKGNVYYCYEFLRKMG